MPAGGRRTALVRAFPWDSQGAVQEEPVVLSLSGVMNGSYIYSRKAAVNTAGGPRHGEAGILKWTQI